MKKYSLMLVALLGLSGTFSVSACGKAFRRTAEELVLMFLNKHCGDVANEDGNEWCFEVKRQYAEAMVDKLGMIKASKDDPSKMFYTKDGSPFSADFLQLWDRLVDQAAYLDEKDTKLPGQLQPGHPQARQAEERLAELAQRHRECVYYPDALENRNLAYYLINQTSFAKEIVRCR